MRDGRVVQAGTPPQVYARPRSRFVADFLGKANFIEAVVTERAGGELRLDSDLGSLRSAMFSESLATGARVTCSLRPEAIRVDHEPADDGREDQARGESDGANVLRARHAETVYLGHVAEHVFEAASGQRISADELKPRPRHWPDGSVRLAFDPEDLVVLAE